MQTLKLITTNGDVMQLKCQELLEIDGKKPCVEQPAISTNELDAQLKVCMLAVATVTDHVDALAVRLNEVCEFLQAEGMVKDG